MTSVVKSEPSKSSEVEWDEARLLSALDRLQNMHIRVRVDPESLNISARLMTIYF
jgi:hypothetical protein